MKKFGNKDGSLIFIETNFGYSVYIEGKNRSKLIKKEIVEKILNLTDKEKEKLFEDILFNVDDILLTIGRYINDGDEFEDGLDIFGDIVTNEEFEISEDEIKENLEQESSKESSRKKLVVLESIEEINNRDPELSQNEIRHLELSKYPFEEFFEMKMSFLVEGEPEDKEYNRIDKMNYVYLFTVGLRKEVEDYCNLVIFPEIFNKKIKNEQKYKLLKLFGRRSLYDILEECQEACTFGRSGNYSYSSTKLREALGLNKKFYLKDEEDSNNYEDIFYIIEETLSKGFNYFSSGRELAHGRAFFRNAYYWYHKNK